MQLKRVSWRVLVRCALAATVGLFACLALQGCNTAHGIIYDIEATGDAANAFIGELTRDRGSYTVWR